MIYMYTYFGLTSINSCFVHVPPQTAGAGHPCWDLERYKIITTIKKCVIPMVLEPESIKWF